MKIFIENCHQNVHQQVTKLFPNAIILDKVDSVFQGRLLVLRNLEVLPFHPQELIESAGRHGSNHAFAIHLRENQGQKLLLIDHSYQIKEEGILPKDYRDAYVLGNVSYHKVDFKMEFLEEPPEYSHFFPQGEHKTIQDYQLEKPALFLDRDGIINRDKGYIYQYSEIEWIEESIQLIKYANEKDYYVFVLTNQSGISQGFYREDDVLKLHTQMNNYLQYHSAKIDHWYYGPYSFRNSIPAYKYYSLTRKPGAGMMLQAMSDYCVDKTKSLMVGDKESDHLIIDGIKFFHYRGKYNLDGVTSPVVDSLLELKEFIE